MKVVLGNLQMELTCEEFKEIYPAISNGHAGTISGPFESKGRGEG